MRIAGFAAVYFAAVFSIGFLLGVVRVLFVAPALGERAAELLEIPVMMLASFAVARWLVWRFRLGVGAAAVGGMLALALLVGAEVAVVLGVRGVTVSQYVADRDPVAGLAYVIALCVFMLAPAAAARWVRRPG